MESFYIGSDTFQVPPDHSVPYRTLDGKVYFLCNFLHDSGSNLSILSRNILEHARGAAIPESKSRTVIGIHGPKTEKYGSIRLSVRNKHFEEVSTSFYNTNFLVNLEGKAHIGHTNSNREFFHFIKDRVQPVVHDLTVDLLSYNTEIFGLLGTENTILLGRQIQDQYPKLGSKFGPGACLMESKINRGHGFVAGIYHTQSSLLGYLSLTKESLFLITVASNC